MSDKEAEVEAAADGGEVDAATAAAGQRSAQGGESRALGGQEVALGLEDATGHAEEASLDSFHNVDDRGQDSSLGTDNSSDDVLNGSNNVITLYK